VKAVRNQPHVGEHDDEALPGLPSALPPGERVLWRGAPDWRILAGRSFHLRKVAVYFGVLIAWRFITSLVDDGSLALAAATTLWTVPLAGLAMGLIALLSWLVASNTVYTLTDRRVVMRVGIVLTVTFNLPLRRIETARLHALPGGAGDIALVLNPQDRIGYIHLWPHARPWHFARTEPMLRALPDAPAVAKLLADALQQSLVTPVRTVAERAGAEPTDAGHGARPPMANAA
jgi:Bacterial PH domain